VPVRGVVLLVPAPLRQHLPPPVPRPAPGPGPAPVRPGRYGPRPDAAEKETDLTPLKDLLRLQGVTFQADAVRGECVAPLLVTRPAGAEVWVDVRHPLVDAGATESAVAALQLRGPAMSSDRLYRLAGPTDVAAPGGLQLLGAGRGRAVPAQWQPVHSRYGDPDGFPARPPVAAAEIVHLALDRLFRTLALSGLPAPGTRSPAPRSPRPTCGAKSPASRPSSTRNWPATPAGAGADRMRSVGARGPRTGGGDRGERNGVHRDDPRRADNPRHTHGRRRPGTRTVPRREAPDPERPGRRGREISGTTSLVGGVPAGRVK
jgi:hypothetical protein